METLEALKDNNKNHTFVKREKKMKREKSVKKEENNENADNNNDNDVCIYAHVLLCKLFVIFVQAFVPIWTKCITYIF